jgi:glycerol-3-phosphate acyltransferase PlsY
LGSIVAGVAFPIAFVVVALYRQGSVLSDSWPLLVFSLLLGALVLVRHRANLGRLLAGTESKIGRRRQDPPPTGSS